MVIQIGTDRSKRDRQCLILRESVNSRRDHREGNGLAAEFFRQFQGVCIAGSLRLKLSILPAIPDRTDRVDDVLRMKAEGGSRSGRASGNLSDLFSLR